MRRQKRFIGFFFFLLTITWFGSAGCLKDYSYEGGPLQDSSLVTDSTLLPDTTVVVQPQLPPDTVLLFPVCAFCKYATSLILGQWNFKYDTTFLCGSVSNAVLAPDKDAFTFFGPSACTPGTGLIITAFFEADTFKADRAGLTSSRVIFQYYDNNAPKDIFLSGPANRFSITINSYELQTGIAIGHFNGTAQTAFDKTATINAGNFKIQLN